MSMHIKETLPKFTSKVKKEWFNCWPFHLTEVDNLKSKLSKLATYFVFFSSYIQTFYFSVLELAGRLRVRTNQIL